MFGSLFGHYSQPQNSGNFVFYWKYVRKYRNLKYESIEKNVSIQNSNQTILSVNTSSPHQECLERVLSSSTTFMPLVA